MNWITGPNRAFGVGETKSQNAVIKVYSADEFKNALTKIYQIPNGIGTIEIAGDIVITQPIKLRQFISSDTTKPAEITIKSISGARILNGNTSSGNYNYDGGTNNEMPVFDFGILTNNVNYNCKYTFQDLNINSVSSRNFGCFIAWKGTDPTVITSYSAPLTITNSKFLNINAIFGIYNDSLSFLPVSSINIMYPVINDLNIGMPTGQNTYLITKRNFGVYYGYFSSINTVQQDKYNRLIIDLQYIGKYAYNTFISCGIPIDVLNGYGGNSSSVFIDCAIGQASISNNTTLGSPTNAFNAESRLYSTINYRSNSDTSLTYESTFEIGNGFGGSDLDIDFSTLTDLSAQIDWKILVKYNASGLINTYHIKTHIRKNAGGTLSIVGNSTIFADEQVFTLTGLTPVISGNKVRMTPVDSGALSIRTDATITVNSYKFA